MTIAVEKVLYTAHATAHGGRDGHTESSDGRLSVDLATPPELGGAADATGTNPEQLFAAGYASCFHSAMHIVARRMQLDVTGSTVSASVGLGPGEGIRGYALVVELSVSLPTVTDEAVARDLLERTDQVCPYSNAVRGNVAVTLTVA